jgi:hypothetical protein
MSATISLRSAAVTFTVNADSAGAKASIWLSSLPHPRPRAHLPPHLEALELRDCNARDLTPTQQLDVVADDRLTEAEVDALFVAEMERRDRVAACPAGYRDAACEACGTTLYAPLGQGGDVLCTGCQDAGAALAAEEDDHPRPPTAGAMHPDYPRFSALACRMADDHLCTAIGIADSDPAQFHLNNPEQRMAFIGAFSAEVVRRLEGRRAV